MRMGMVDGNHLRRFFFHLLRRPSAALGVVSDISQIPLCILKLENLLNGLPFSAQNPATLQWLLLSRMFNHSLIDRPWNADHTIVHMFKRLMH